MCRTENQLCLAGLKVVSVEKGIRESQTRKEDRADQEQNAPGPEQRQALPFPERKKVAWSAHCFKFTRTRTPGKEAQTAGQAAPRHCGMHPGENQVGNLCSQVPRTQSQPASFEEDSEGQIASVLSLYSLLFLSLFPEQQDTYLHRVRYKSPREDLKHPGRSEYVPCKSVIIYRRHLSILRFWYPQRTLEPTSRAHHGITLLHPKAQPGTCIGDVRETRRAEEHIRARTP